MIAISPRIGHAMGQQLERVNDAKAAAHESVDDFLAEQSPGRLIAELRRQLAESLRENDRLRERLALRELPGVMALNGRAVLTPARVAREQHVSVATVNRYVTSGFWEAEQDDRGHWLIYAEQAFARPERRNKKTRS